MATLRVLFPFEDDHLEQQQFSQLHRIILGFDSSDLTQELTSGNAITEVNVGDISGTTPLMWAARRGDANAVQTLLEYHANPNLCNDVLQSPLIHAVRSSSLPCLDLLLEAGADPTHVDSRQFNALYYAVMHHADLKLVHRLIAAGTEVNRQGCQGVTPVHYTILEDQDQLARVLLDNGAHVDSVDGEGDSILHQTIFYQAKKVLRLLLDRGACRTSHNLWGRSILHYAALYSDLETLEILRSANFEGVEPDAIDLEGKTPFRLAQERAETPKNYLETIEKLFNEIRTRNEMQSRASSRVCRPKKIPLFDLIRAGLQAKELHVCTRLDIWHVEKSALLYLLLGIGWAGFLYKLL